MQTTMAMLLSSALAAGFLAVAVWLDFRYHRIPNSLTGSLFASAVIMHVGLNGLGGLGDALGGMAVGVLIFLIPYLLRGMGAGDVKLMAAVGAVLGPTQALTAACATLIVGGLIGLLVIAYNNSPKAGAEDAALMMKFPYASAIAFGTATALTGLENVWTWMS